MMLENAVEKGSGVMTGAVAKRLLMDGDICTGLLVERNGRSFRLRAPVTIDCGGRHGFAATQLGWLVPDPHLNKVAIWSYYRGAKRELGMGRRGDHRGLPAPRGLVLVYPVAERHR